MRATRHLIAAGFMFAIAVTHLPHVHAEELTAAELIERGNAAVDSLDLDAAQKAYEAALALTPQDPKLHYNLARVYESQQKFTKARVHLQTFANTASKELLAKVPNLETRRQSIDAHVGHVFVRCSPVEPTARVVIAETQTSGCRADETRIEFDMPDPNKTFDAVLLEDARAISEHVPFRTGAHITLRRFAPTAARAPLGPAHDETSGTSGRDVAAVALMGSGGAAAVVGAVLGVTVLTAKSEIATECGPESPRCASDAQRRNAEALYSGAQTRATLSTVLVPVGVVLGGAGLVLWLTRGNNVRVSAQRVEATWHF